MPNEKILIIAITGALVTIVLCTGILVFFVIFQRKKSQQLAEQTRHQQEILQTQIEIQQQSFHNISQEIHDNIGQVLSLIKLNLNRVSEQTSSQPYHEKIMNTVDLAGQVMTDLRNLSKGLNPDFVAQFGLAGCIGYELERLQHTGLYQTNMAVNGEAFVLGLPKEFVLYRVIQECLNNIIKHAAASQVNTTIDYLPQLLTVTVTDNGKGFDMGTSSHSPAAAGSGLANMKKRIEMIGGQFNCNSTLGTGTTIQLQVPAG